MPITHDDSYGSDTTDYRKLSNRLAVECSRLETLCKIRGDALDAVKIWDDSRAPASIKAEQWPMIVDLIDKAMEEKP